MKFDPMKPQPPVTNTFTAGLRKTLLGKRKTENGKRRGHTPFSRFPFPVSRSVSYDADLGVVADQEAVHAGPFHAGMDAHVCPDQGVGDPRRDPLQARPLQDDRVLDLASLDEAARSDGRLIDPRLVQAAAAGANESVPSDGGFAVQIDFQQGILERMYSDGEILDRLERIPISPNANGVKINAVDEDSRVDGSRWGGLQAFWANEADPYTASKAKYRQIELRLNKLTGLSYVTDELVHHDPRVATA